MVNENKLTINKLFVLKPIVISACAAVLSFYYFFCAIGNYFNKFLIISIFILSFIIGFIFRKKKFLFIFAGLFIGSLAVLRLFFIYAEPFSLAELNKVKSIQAELTGEAYPAGDKYYAANAKLISFSYNNGAKFSAKGNIKIFFSFGAGLTK
nr:hypothetical protein [Treponema denticola]